MKKGLLILLALSFVLLSGAKTATGVTLTAAELGANNWPNFRGPNWDGVYPGTDWDPARLGAADLLVWSVNIGSGYPAPTIYRDRLYITGSSGAQDRVFCLNALTGAQIWMQQYAAADGEYSGPRSSPTYYDGKVYAMGRKGQLYCYNADTGAMIWNIQLSRLGAQTPGWDLAGSPRIVGNLLLLNANQYGIALNPNNGAVVWSSPAGVGGYTTPVLFDAGGRRLAAIFGQNQLYTVESETGRLVWQFEWATGCDVDASDPLVFNNRMFVSSGYGHGCALVDFASGRPVGVWSNQSVMSHFQSHVFYNGYIYAASGDAGNSYGSALVCLNPANGVPAWSARLGFGSFILAQDKAIYLNESGQITIGALTPTAFNQLAQASVPGGEGLYWTAPVMAHGLLYTRSDSGRLSCLDLRRR